MILMGKRTGYLEVLFVILFSFYIYLRSLIGLRIILLSSVLIFVTDVEWFDDFPERLPRMNSFM